RTSCLPYPMCQGQRVVRASQALDAERLLTAREPMPWAPGLPPISRPGGLARCTTLGPGLSAGIP
ncbi:MAG: hypothetical protein ACK54K_04870, partial [Gemmatimonadaceae bacterium]